MRMFGTILPFIGRAIAPCSGDGEPAMSLEEVGSAAHETKVVMIAWLGRVMAWPYGEVKPRLIDPENPRQYAPGNL